MGGAAGHATHKGKGLVGGAAGHETTGKPGQIPLPFLRGVWVASRNPTCHAYYELRTKNENRMSKDEGQTKIDGRRTKSTKIGGQKLHYWATVHQAFSRARSDIAD